MRRNDNRKQAAAALAAAAAGGGAGAAAAHPTSIRQPSLAKHRSRQAPAHTPDRSAELYAVPAVAARGGHALCRPLVLPPTSKQAVAASSIAHCQV